MIFGMQETVYQFYINTAHPKSRADIKHTVRSECTDVCLCPSVRSLHVFLGSMRRRREEERVRITSEITTFGAESLEGQVGASMLKSQG